MSDEKPKFTGARYAALTDDGTRLDAVLWKPEGWVPPPSIDVHNVDQGTVSLIYQGPVSSDA